MRKTIKINGKIACDIINSWLPNNYEKMEYPSGSKTIEVKVLDQDENNLPGKGREVFEIELDRDWFITKEEAEEFSRWEKETGRGD